MAHSKITLVGLYRFLDQEGDDLFSEMILPADIDRQTFIDSVMLRGAEFEILYADPDTMKYAIGAWSKKWQRTLTKWARVLSMDYNPIENYDRMESWSDARSANGKQKGSASDASVMNGTAENEEKRSAYDSTTYSPLNKNENKSENTASSASVTNAETENAESALHSGRIHGNIGVKTTQSMIAEEVSVAALNVYESAADLFLTELTIYTY